MEGEEALSPEYLDNKKSKKKDEENVGPFFTKSKRARLLVLLAGVFMNFVFGVLAFAVIYTKVGIPTPLAQPIISSIEEGSPAAEAGMQLGDQVIAISNGDRNPVDNPREFVEYIGDHQGETIAFIVLRDGAEQTVEVYARAENERPEGAGAIGVGFDALELKFYPWWQMPLRGMWIGLQQSIGLSWLIVQAFADIFVQLFTQARVPEGVAGPVGIVHQASKTGLFQEGWLTILNFSAMLSINLAILNVLPIPALDGGRVVFVLLETVIGKELRDKIENRANYLGFGMLLILIITITLKDVWMVIKDFAL